MPSARVPTLGADDYVAKPSSPHELVARVRPVLRRTTLERHINNLRKKLEPDPDQPKYVLIVYGVGCKMRK